MVYSSGAYLSRRSQEARPKTLLFMAKLERWGLLAEQGMGRGELSGQRE